MERYWRPRLARSGPGAFEIYALMRGYDGVPARTHFRFTSTGKISLTPCAPIRAAA